MVEKEITKPVDIIQELIAIHTTRIEASIRLQPGEIKAVLNTIQNQSKNFITELMDELSNYGDAVQSIAERENDYQRIWTDNLKKLDTLNSDDSKAILENLEESLKKIYSEILDADITLPESLLQILMQQQAAL
jgi:hypothetical protein